MKISRILILAHCSALPIFWRFQRNNPAWSITHDQHSQTSGTKDVKGQGELDLEADNTSRPPFSGGRPDKN
jgi:hypothetical protein